MKKCVVKINTAPEKAIISASLSVAGAILFHKKGKIFFKKVGRNYRFIDRALDLTAARNIVKNEKVKAENAAEGEYKTKLKDLKIEKADFIDL